MKTWLKYEVLRTQFPAYRFEMTICEYMIVDYQLKQAVDFSGTGIPQT